jgi:iron(III) transport system ATP-binding protein
MKKSEIKKRVMALLDQVGMPDYGPKYPATLSGGQQQRVALARALAISPGMLLLDEPLSALDAKVRVYLRHELRQLQNKLGITTIMVTHDQEEALSMADKIVVMNHGVIEQVGTPMDIYRHPANAYVADFVGSMNFIPGIVSSENKVKIGDIDIQVNVKAAGFKSGDEVTISIRPEDVLVRDVTGKSENSNAMEIVDIEFLGSFCRANLISENLHGEHGEPLVADFSINLMRDIDLSKGSKLQVSLPSKRLQLFPRKS